MKSQARPRWILAMLLTLTFASTSGAQDYPRLLEDFVHYTTVAKPDLAAASAQMLLESGLTNAELTQILEEGEVSIDRFDQAIARARTIDGLEEVAGRLSVRVERGRLDMARDQNRIEQAIHMLVGHQRHQMLAKRRLQAAGEYAVPALLREITEGRDDRLQLKCTQTLVEIGRQAVTPLCAALSHIGEPDQRTVCDMLGEIGWQHAAPYLKELSENDMAGGPVRDAAMRAFRRVGGLDVDSATLFTLLSQQYFNDAESLVAFPYEATNNVWGYDTFTGLVATPVPTPIFTEVMAMRTSSRALQHDPSHQNALSLFVAANLKRENEIPAGEDDPIFGTMTYSPDFYATVFGTRVCQDVLALAIDSLDTSLVRDAITALSQTTGGANLYVNDMTRQPLLEAVNYPDRRVRYEAALTLASALPARTFSGAESVVPLLASAVRTGNRSFALVVADSEESQRQHVSRLQSLGFEIIAVESNTSSVRGDIAQAVGVDLIVVDKNSAESTIATVTEFRGMAKTSATPTVVMAAGTDAVRVVREYQLDSRTNAWRPGLDAGLEEFSSAVDLVLQSGSGGRITEAEAEIYAIESLEALRDIAISNSSVYSLRDAEVALLDALDSRDGGTRMLVARILAMIDTETAQQALFEAALVGDEDQVDLLDYAAESVKRFGDRSSGHHPTAVLDLVIASTGDVADAAARLHGAMNLPADAAVELIP